MDNALLQARIEKIEALLELALIRGNTLSATASGTIDALGNVTINHATSNIASITANIGLNTLTLNFASPFDVDGIYFTVAFIYDPAVGTSPFLPITQNATQTVYLGFYPPPGPWNFALFAVSNS